MSQELRSSSRCSRPKTLADFPAELAAFALPYRDQLLALWQGDMALSRLRIAAMLPDLGVLWRATT
jgi:hypothetical protein